MKNKDKLLKISKWIKADKKGNPTNNMREFYEIDTPKITTKNEMKNLEEYLSIVLNLTEGNRNPKKIKVVEYLLKNLTLTNPILLTTTRELAETCDVSHPTALDTLKFMESLGLIKRRSGAVVFVPERAEELIKASQQVKLYLPK